MTDITTAPATAQTVFEACKAALFPVLAEHGIARVVIGYDGEGDEGQVNDITAYTATGEELGLPSVDVERHQLNYNGSVTSDLIGLDHALDSFAVEALCALHSGWEDGNGACGELELLVESGTATLTHNSRFIDYDTASSEL